MLYTEYDVASFLRVLNFSFTFYVLVSVFKLEMEKNANLMMCPSSNTNADLGFYSSGSY